MSETNPDEISKLKKSRYLSEVKILSKLLKFLVKKPLLTVLQCNCSARKCCPWTVSHLTKGNHHFLQSYPLLFRYVRYFANLISGITKVNPSPIHLQSISFYQFPIGKTVVLKVYERMKPVYNSEKL